jgi:two-component system NtrC family sensor kinase
MIYKILKLFFKMKRILFILLVFITFNSYAQDRTADSLKQLLNTEIADTTRVLVLRSLAYQYCETKPDTALILGQQGLAIARQNGFVRGEAGCLSSLGLIFMKNGNYSKSLDYYLQALKLYESLNDNDRISGVYINIGLVYNIMGDEQMAMNYIRKGKTLAESRHDTLTVNSTLINLGNIYLNLNQLDSARIYMNQSYELAIRLNDASTKAGILNNLGNLHSTMQQDEIAMGYYRQSLSIEKELKSLGAGVTVTLNMAKIFK